MDFNIPWERFKFTRDLIGQIRDYFALYLRNPVEAVRQLPPWEWPTVFALLGGFAAACGVFNGLMSFSILNIFAGLIFTPLFCVGVSALAAFLFQHFARQIFSRELSFDRLFTLFAVSNVPFLVSFLFSPILSFLLLIGLLLSFVLLGVGLVDNFALPRRRVFRWLAGLYAVAAIFWVALTIRELSLRENMRQTATPESLDILEQELRDK